MKLQGMEIVGSPVGSLDFCRGFVERTLEIMLRESKSLVDLHPQCATKILKECVCAAPCYLAQVCHPNLTKEYLVDFDERVWDILTEVVGGIGGGDQLNCCAEGISRAKTRAFLPSRFNGAGFRSWERTADFAWFASVASCIGLKDQDFDRARQRFGRAGEEAYHFVWEALGGASYLRKCHIELMPVGEDDVLTSSNYYKNFFEDSPKCKLQKELTEVICTLDHEKLLKNGLDHAHITDSEKIYIEGDTAMQ